MPPFLCKPPLGQGNAVHLLVRAKFIVVPVTAAALVLGAALFLSPIARASSCGELWRVYSQSNTNCRRSGDRFQCAAARNYHNAYRAGCGGARKTTTRQRGASPLSRLNAGISAVMMLQQLFNQSQRGDRTVDGTAMRPRYDAAIDRARRMALEQAQRDRQRHAEAQVRRQRRCAADMPSSFGAARGSGCDVRNPWARDYDSVTERYCRDEISFVAGDVCIPDEVRDMIAEAGEKGWNRLVRESVASMEANDPEMWVLTVEDYRRIGAGGDPDEIASDRWSEWLQASVQKRLEEIRRSIREEKRTPFD